MAAHFGECIAGAAEKLQLGHGKRGRRVWPTHATVKGKMHLDDVCATRHGGEPWKDAARVIGKPDWAAIAATVLVDELEADLRQGCRVSAGALQNDRRGATGPHAG